MDRRLIRIKIFLQELSEAEQDKVRFASNWHFQRPGHIAESKSTNRLQTDRLLGVVSIYLSFSNYFVLSVDVTGVSTVVCHNCF